MSTLTMRDWADRHIERIETELRQTPPWRPLRRWRLRARLEAARIERDIYEDLARAMIAAQPERRDWFRL